jgi:hypothetical protein
MAFRQKRPVAMLSLRRNTHKPANKARIGDEQEKMMKEPKYNIFWLVNAVRLGKHGKRYISLGYCGKTRKVAFISTLHEGKPVTLESVKHFIIRDVYVNDECEDAKHCWNLTCPLNKLDPKQMRKYGVKTKEDAEKMAQRIQEIGDKLTNEVKWNKPNATVIFKEPAFTITQKRNKRTQ